MATGPAPFQTLAPGDPMERKPHENQLAFDDAVEDFDLPFGGQLRRDNR